MYSKILSEVYEGMREFLLLNEQHEYTRRNTRFAEVALKL